MKTASCKAKGRKLQYQVRDDLRDLGSELGLENDDIKSTPMGSSGVDIQLSPAGRKLFPVAVECKNVEKLNVASVFFEHYTKHYGEREIKLLVHSKNRTEPLVTLRWADFLVLLEYQAAVLKVQE